MALREDARMCDYAKCDAPPALLVVMRVGTDRNRYPRRELCAHHGTLTIETGKVHMVRPLPVEGKLPELRRRVDVDRYFERQAS